MTDLADDELQLTVDSVVRRPQGLVALVGDGTTVLLADDDTDPANVFETLTSVQRAVLRARLEVWLEYLTVTDSEPSERVR